MSNYAWTKSLQALHDEFHRLASDGEELRHAVLLLPSCHKWPTTELERLSSQLLGHEPCIEPQILAVLGGQQVHYFFGDRALYDDFFFRMAKHATDQVKKELADEFPNFPLLKDLTVNQQLLMTWICLLYHRASKFPGGGIAAQWQYAERTHAGRRPMSDDLEDYVTSAAIDVFLAPGAPALAQWPQPSPYFDFDLGAFISLVDLDDRLDRPRNKYWDDEGLPFPALFCAQLRGNIFDVSAAAVKSVLSHVPPIRVDVDGSGEESTATLGRLTIVLDSEVIATFLKHIVDGRPDVVSTTTMKEKSPFLKDVSHLERLPDKIPAKIRQYIEPVQGRGYRWRG